MEHYVRDYRLIRMKNGQLTIGEVYYDDRLTAVKVKFDYQFPFGKTKEDVMRTVLDMSTDDILDISYFENLTNK